MKLDSIVYDIPALANALTEKLVEESPTFNAMYPSQTATSLVNTLAGVGSMLQYTVVSAMANAYMDSAFSPSGIYQLAETLGNNLHGNIAARLVCEITRINCRGNSILIPAGSQFEVEGIPFFNVDEINFAPRYNTVKNITLMQGHLVTVERTTAGIPNEKLYFSADFKADPNNIKVFVNGEQWNIAETFISYDTGSVIDASELKVVVVKTDAEGRTYVKLGNGINGLLPSANSIVKIQYVSNDGEEGNITKNNLDIKLLTPIYQNNELLEVEFPVSTTSYGGAPQQSLEVLKATSPNIFASGHRAIRRDDYRALLMNKCGYLSANVWGEYEESQYFGYYDKIMMNMVYYTGIKSFQIYDYSIIGTLGESNYFAGVIGTLTGFPGSYSVKINSTEDPLNYIMYTDNKGVGLLFNNNDRQFPIDNLMTDYHNERVSIDTTSAKEVLGKEIVNIVNNDKNIYNYVKSGDSAVFAYSVSRGSTPLSNLVVGDSFDTNIDILDINTGLSTRLFIVAVEDNDSVKLITNPSYGSSNISTRSITITKGGSSETVTITTTNNRADLSAGDYVDSVNLLLNRTFNAGIIGSITNEVNSLNSYTLSGFGANSYLQLPNTKIFSPGYNETMANSWEACFVVQTPISADARDKNVIFSKNYSIGFSLVKDNNKLVPSLSLSSNGQTWDICNDLRVLSSVDNASVYVFEYDTPYNIKLRYDAYSGKYSVIVENLKTGVAPIEVIDIINFKYVFGGNNMIGSDGTDYWPSSIDLKQSYININDDLFWSYITDDTTYVTITSTVVNSSTINLSFNPRISLTKIADHCVSLNRFVLCDNSVIATIGQELQFVDNSGYFESYSAPSLISPTQITFNYSFIGDGSISTLQPIAGIKFKTTSDLTSIERSFIKTFAMYGTNENVPEKYINNNGVLELNEQYAKFYNNVKNNTSRWTKIVERTILEDPGLGQWTDWIGTTLYQPNNDLDWSAFRNYVIEIYSTHSDNISSPVKISKIKLLYDSIKIRDEESNVVSDIQQASTINYDQFGSFNIYIPQLLESQNIYRYTVEVSNLSEVNKYSLGDNLYFDYDVTNVSEAYPYKYEVKITNPGSGYSTNVSGNPGIDEVLVGSTGLVFKITQVNEDGEVLSGYLLNDSGLNLYNINSINAVYKDGVVGLGSGLQFSVKTHNSKIRFNVSVNNLQANGNNNSYTYNVSINNSTNLIGNINIMVDNQLLNNMSSLSTASGATITIKSSKDLNVSADYTGNRISNTDISLIDQMIIDEYNHFTTYVEFKQPQVVRADIVVRIKYTNDAHKSIAKQNVYNAVSSLFNITPDYLGKSLELSSIYNVVHSVEGVDYCLIDLPVANINVLPNEFLILSSLEILDI